MLLTWKSIFTFITFLPLKRTVNDDNLGRLGFRRVAVLILDNTVELSAVRFFRHFKLILPTGLRRDLFERLVVPVFIVPGVCHAISIMGGQ